MNPLKKPNHSGVTPVSWWLQDHIEEAREHLNFSTGATNDEQAEALEECAEEVSEGKMPLNSYTWAHSEARLSQTEKQQLVNWFQQNGGGGETGEGDNGLEEAEEED